MKIIITNTSIITQNKHREILHHFNVVIENGYIQSLFSGPVSNKKFTDHTVIDGRNFFLSPGFINTHIHLGEAIYKDSFGDFVGLADYIKDTNLLSKRFSMVESGRDTIADFSLKLSLKGGATTICGGRILRHCKRRGIKGVSLYMLMNSPKLKNFLSNAYEKIKDELMHKKTHGVFIHSLNTISLHQLSMVNKLISEFPNLKICIHIGETSAQEQSIIRKYGRTAIELLSEYGLLGPNLLLIHGGNLSKKDYNTIKKHHTHIIHCLTSNLTVADTTIKVQELLQAGINVCLATDGLITGSSLDMLHEAYMNFIYHNQFSHTTLTTQKILDMMTINPAQALGLFDIGSIEIGKKADILFFKKDSHEYLVHNMIFYRPSIYGVMIDGEFKLRNYKITTKDENKIDQKFNSLIDFIHENSSR